jgi:hypothetical protein
MRVAHNYAPGSYARITVITDIFIQYGARKLLRLQH